VKHNGRDVTAKCQGAQDVGHNGRVPRHGVISTVGILFYLLKAQDMGCNGKVPRHDVISTVGILFD
jgi:hypothetical protein